MRKIFLYFGNLEFFSLSLLIMLFVSFETSAQSLTEQFSQQGQHVPEYRVVSERNAWEEVEQGRDISHAWDLVNSNSIEIFRCGDNSSNLSQPSLHFSETKGYCDFALGGICYSMDSSVKNAPFLYAVDRADQGVYFIGEYSVRGLYQFGVPRDIEVRRPNPARIKGIFFQHEGSVGSRISFKMQSDCELNTLENALYCSAGNGQRVYRTQCHPYSLQAMRNEVLDFAYRFIESRAIAECQSSRVRDASHQAYCIGPGWENFID
jgi:hypothetical protein